MYDPETVEKARERDGDRGDRPDEIDSLLTWVQLGKGVGAPVAEGVDDYSRYPDSRESLSSPKWGTLIKEVFQSPAVNGYEDAARELFGPGDSLVNRKRREALQHAAQSAGLDAGSLFAEGNERDCGGPVAAQKQLTSDLSTHITDGQNPLALAFVYVEKGLSCKELDDVFELQGGTARRRLHDIGLVVSREDKPEGKTADELLVESGDGSEVDDADEKLGGLNINAESVRSDPNVSVQTGSE